MDITFLGTGGAWGVPEVNCDCLICRDMRRKGEKRERTSLLLTGEATLLIDCGPDAKSQLLRHDIKTIDGVLITHEHTDHYIGLDELFAYKRNRPRGSFTPIPIYLSSKSCDVIRKRFDYLEDMDVISMCLIEPGQWFEVKAFEILSFDTYHGAFAKGSVGFLVKVKGASGGEQRIVYTSDFSDIPDLPPDLLQPDYLVIQSFWLNEPVHNRPNHMSFQRAIHFIERLKPKKETFLVHIGDADMVANDPANSLLKKYKPKDPMRPPSGGEPYPIPLNQEQWQKTVDRIVSDRDLPYKITVAYDDLCVHL
ncbi:MAG: MBL fold metallo-hydrolase [Deltaproteobacteria bacterium]|nr:MBL fold metallo-hydrolase [Deltaproteobacteria bacterium]